MSQKQKITLSLVLEKDLNISYNVLEDSFNICTKKEFVMYLKGRFTNKERFISRYIDNKLAQLDEMFPHEMPEESQAYFRQLEKVAREQFQIFIDMYDDVEPFTYKQAFELKNDQFQAIVFQSINITDMIDNLGKTKVKVDGIPVKREVYNDEGELTGYKEYENIYETYKIDGSKLKIDDCAVVRCWCTSTNKEHWLWIDEANINDPLTAIAATFFIHGNILPHVQALKRQGDIMLVEMKPGFEDIKPEGEPRPLTKDEYFGLLVAES